MGEICKDPENKAPANAIEGDTAIIKFMIRARGAAAVLRACQYAMEEEAAEMLQEAARIDKIQNPGSIGPATLQEYAGKFLKAADAIEEPYQTIKNEIKL